MPTHHLRLFSSEEGRTGKELLYFFFDPRGQVRSPLQFAHAIVPDGHKDDARILDRATCFFFLDKFNYSKCMAGQYDAR